jgi:hypothetical protein
MCFLVPVVLHQSIFEAVRDAELLAEPENSLRLGVLGSTGVSKKSNARIEMSVVANCWIDKRHDEGVVGAWKNGSMLGLTENLTLR